MAREVLLLEQGNSKFASVVRANGVLFLSSVDGVYKVGTSEIDEESFGDGPAQAANAYAEIARRLEVCGLSGAAAVRIEHATASQDWRLQRMALWPQHFGLPTTAVSQGYQGKMERQNMITVASVACMPDLFRELISPGPNSGRASRVTRCGDFVYIIGVRGETSLSDGSKCSDGLIENTREHIEHSMANIDFHLHSSGRASKDLVRIDAFMRSPYDAPLLRMILENYMKRTGSSFSVNAVACPLGGGTDIEISAIASVSGHVKPKGKLNEESTTNASVVAGGFGFISTALVDSGVRRKVDVGVGLESHFKAGFDVLEQRIKSLGSNRSQIVRLDIFLASPYARPHIADLLEKEFNDVVPPIVWHGVDLPDGLQVDVSAVVIVE